MSDMPTTSFTTQIDPDLKRRLEQIAGCRSLMAGGGRVFAALDVTLERLQNTPYSGHPFDDFDDVRELPITRSPFSILCAVRNETIFIIDVRGRRGLRSALALAEFVRDLKSKYGFE